MPILRNGLDEIGSPVFIVGIGWFRPHFGRSPALPGTTGCYREDRISSYESV
jgi:hypothetical protein